MISWPESSHSPAFTCRWRHHTHLPEDGCIASTSTILTTRRQHLRPKPPRLHVVARRPRPRMPLEACPLKVLHREAVLPHLRRQRVAEDRQVAEALPVREEPMGLPVPRLREVAEVRRRREGEAGDVGPDLAGRVPGLEGDADHVGCDADSAVGGLELAG